MNFQDHGSCPLPSIRIDVEQQLAISPQNHFQLGFFNLFEEKLIQIGPYCQGVNMKKYMNMMENTTYNT